jgi:uncharacterized protein
VLLRELEHLKLPIIAVAGNHDHESDQIELLVKMMTDSGIHVLDGSVCKIKDVGFVGTKGFCGGFDKLAVQPFGERALKIFIQASINEAAHLDSILAQLECEKRVAILHFSPIKKTLEGEERELYPFLGSSLLARSLDRHGVDVIVHGHAHHGSLEGETPRGIPVHNVCRFVRIRAGLKPYFVFEV